MFTKSGKRLFILAQVFRRLLGGLLVFYLSRYYSKNDYGELMYFLIAGSFFILSLDFGFLESTTRELSKKIKTPLFYVNKSIEVKAILFGTLFMVYLLGLAFKVWAFSYWHLLLAIWGISESLMFTYFAIKRSRHQFGQEAIIIISKEVLFIMSSIALAIAGYDIIWVELSISTLSLLFLLILVIRYRAYICRISISIQSTIHEKKMLKILLCFFIISMSYQLVFRLDSLMVKHFLSYKDLSVYEVASSIARNLRVIPAAITTIFFPLIASRSHTQKVLPTILRQLTIILLLSFLVLIGQLVLGKEVILYVFSSKYHDSIPVMYIYSFTAIPAFLNGAIVSTLCALSKHRQAMMVNTTIIIFTLSINYYTIPKYGIFGATYSSIISEFLALFLGGYLIFKFFRPSVPKTSL